MATEELKVFQSNSPSFWRFFSTYYCINKYYSTILFIWANVEKNLLNILKKFRVVCAILRVIGAIFSLFMQICAVVGVNMQNVPFVRHIGVNLCLVFPAFCLRAKTTQLHFLRERWCKIVLFV